MPNEAFAKLIDKRKEWVRVSKENKFDFGSILAGLYNDPSHFIYEILQNAEDKNAQEVVFKLFEDRLDIYHDGKLFDFDDIKGVTGIGIPTKRGDPHAIGKFGIGFKSVFAVTETPHIFSGEYKIRIEDFVIPSEINDNGQISNTLIQLPFNHAHRTKEEVFHLVSERLKNLGLKTLLFLKNIREIRWEIPFSKGHYLKSSEDIQNISGTKRVTLISAKDAEDTEEYIVIEKPIKIENKELKIEVAYKLGKDKSDKEIVIPEPDSKLAVFFPTDKVTFLNFIIQGPYKTTPNRENIPLDDEQNKKIIEETGNLIVESLSIIKTLGYLDTNFLKVLSINPVHKESDQIYSVIYEKVKEKFLSDEELLPTSNGKYTKASDALLTDGEKLADFLAMNDLEILFAKKYWLDTSITDAKARELRNYLKNELGIVEVDFESFARKITVDFLREKSDNWMIDFYNHLLKQEALWRDSGHSSKSGILRTKPIIRLETNEHIAPFDDKGKVQVYLPTETKSKYRTVKHILIENEDSLKFLKELGLTKPDIFAEIEEFILPKYQTDNANKDEEYFEDFEKLLTAYGNIPSSKKNEFIKRLSNTSFIDSVNNATGEFALLKPSKIYLRTRELEEYFDSIAEIYFVSNELLKKYGEERLISFLKELGVENKPRRIEIEAKLSWEEKSKLRGSSGHTRDIHQKDYEYEGLDSFIKQMTVNKSYLLWELLLKNIETLSSWEAKGFFEGEYIWLFRREYSAKFDAKFLKTLKQQTWLVDKDNNFKRPSDITSAELSNSYTKESPNIEILVKVLELKSGIIDQLPEKERKMLKLLKEKGLSIEDIERLPAKKEPPELPEKVWTPEYKPGEIDAKIEEIEPEKILTPDLGNQELEGSGIKDPPDVYIPKPPRRVGSKEIGIWGEKQVYCALEKKYEEIGAVVETDFGFKANHGNEEFEIVWLNKHHNTGKGYDFVIKKNGIEIEYIEVKTKVQGIEELIEVTGTQWEFARKLHEQDEGEKYLFYAVFNAGKSNAEIKILRNPIRLWKNGKLYAHPINFRI